MPQREPVYQGKRLGQYLAEMADKSPYGPNDSAVEAVYQMGPEAIPYLRRALHRRDSYRVKGLIFLHAKLLKSMSRHLPAAPDEEHLRREVWVAAQCLEAFGPLARSAVPDLLECFKDDRTISPAYGAIRQIGPKPEDLPALLKYLSSTNWIVRSYAVDCIGLIGVTNKQVLSALINTAQDTHSRSCRHAINALGALGVKAEPAIPVLTQNLADHDGNIRIASAYALWCVQGKTNAPIAFLSRELETEINNGNGSTTTWAAGPHEHNLAIIASLLEEMGSEARSAAPLLQRAKKTTENVAVRMGLAEAMWKINAETNDFVSICEEGLNNADTYQQERAAELLSVFCIDKRLDLPELHELSGLKDPIVQFYAARALWKITGQTTNIIPVLINGLRDHSLGYHNQQIRRLAAETLGELGPRANLAVPDLKIALHDGVEAVRTASTNALKQIDPDGARRLNLK
ncbi:MAG: hypothetical protein JWR26_1275 [Pedosphaera sp.]|nr:hypothetical protein [Pedosphaera sp.]